MSLICVTKTSVSDFVIAVFKVMRSYCGWAVLVSLSCDREGTSAVHSTLAEYSSSSETTYSISFYLLFWIQTSAVFALCKCFNTALTLQKWKCSVMFLSTCYHWMESVKIQLLQGISGQNTASLSVFGLNSCLLGLSASQISNKLKVCFVLLLF